MLTKAVAGKQSGIMAAACSIARTKTLAYLCSGQLGCNLTKLCIWASPILGMQSMAHLRMRR